MILSLATNLQGDDPLTAPLAFFAMIAATYDISGGHLNPAVSVGVYFSERRFLPHMVYMIFYIVAQTMGALLALCFGYLVRVTVDKEGTDMQYLVPSVHADVPP